jgi:hypothetical protein
MQIAYGVVLDDGLHDHLIEAKCTLHRFQYRSPREIDKRFVEYLVASNCPRAPYSHGE